MKKHLMILIFSLIILLDVRAYADYSGSFVVGGDLGKYYPVVVYDAAWADNKATEFDLGRSDIHTDQSWRGSMIAKFRIHTYDWGHGSNFIDANIRQYDPDNQKYFIAGWQDATNANGNSVIIVWLQGGNTTYYFHSPSNISFTVYDGVHNALPYQQTNGPQWTYKTAIEPWINSSGENIGGTAFFTGPSANFFAGNVGIGTMQPDQKLTVNGTIHSTAVKVDTSIPVPDYVFEESYKPVDLESLKSYLSANHHLPEIPSAIEMKKEGLNLGDINLKLLKKVEELTLYLIEQNKQLKDQSKRLAKQQLTNDRLQQQINLLKRKK